MQLLATAVVIAGLLTLRAFQTVVPMATLRAELAQLPVPAGARLLEVDESGKSPAIFSHYQTSLKRSDIARHYTAAALRAGWQSCGEEQVRDWGRDLGDRSYEFIKGEIAVHIFIPADPRVYGYHYAVDIVKRSLWPWQSRGCG